MKKTILKKVFFLLCMLLVGVASVSAEDYVKWKSVDIGNETLSEGEVVVIVDLTTGMAMSNDNGSSAPNAVAVELNYDNDRLLGEVPENVQWTLERTDGDWQFATNTTDDQGQTTKSYLYADSKKLKVGTSDDKNFIIKRYDGIAYLAISIKAKDSEESTVYLAGVSTSMFSNTWTLKAVKDDQPDEKVENTRFAILSA